jgi:hypothetical protein
MCVPGGSRVAGSACRVITCILWALGTFSYFRAHQERHGSACDYVEVSNQTKGRPACAITMSKSTKCTGSLQRKHALEFGLEIVELKEKGNMLLMMGMHCLFYMYHG